MHGTMSKIILALVFVVSLGLPSVALAKNGERLMTINDIEYTNDDFVNWWKRWNDKNILTFPDSPGDFIDFQLMVQQGKEMGYESNPSYLRKIDVFLQVRALMALKYEEIDSKVSITDADLREFFKDNFSEEWVMQILAFDSEAKAQKAYEYMLPFRGQVAGRLVFADLYGASPEEKADTYDESRASVTDFRKNKKDAWLPIVKKLEIGEVSEPFFSEDKGKYVLVRLIEKRTLGDNEFEKNKQKMSEQLHKIRAGQLTEDLIERLKSKYNVQVNRELFDEIKLDVEYPKEFLDRKLITMSELEVTVNDFIYGAHKEKLTRKGLADEVIKSLVLNSIISQTLLTKESLARGYEKRPPLQASYEFYKQSRLRMEVEAGLKANLVVTDQDLQRYYDINIAAYSVPDKFTFFLLEGDKDVLNKIWVGTLQGGDFAELARKYSFDAQTQKKGVDTISQVVLLELKKLDKGGVSAPFELDGTYGLLKLIEILPGETQTLAQVKDKALEQLKKEKFEIIKAEYLSKLKSRSQIDINKRVWKGLVRELGNEKND